MPKLRYSKSNYTITLPKCIVEYIGWEKGDDIHVVFDPENGGFKLYEFHKMLNHKEKLRKSLKQENKLSEDEPTEDPLPPELKDHTW